MITKEYAKSIITLSGVPHRTFSRESGCGRNTAYHLFKHGYISNENLEKIETYARQNGLLPEQTEALNKAMLNALSVPVDEDPFTLGDMAAIMLVIILSIITLILFLV